MDALLAFAATLVSLRLAGALLGRYRARRETALLAWSASLSAFAIGSGALAWGAAAGWDDRVFRVYYLFGGLLAAALLGAGSLLRAGRAWAGPLAIAYGGLATGVALAVELTLPVSGSSIPAAQDHLELVPARLLAILGNTLGTVAAVAIALAGMRRRPLGNGLILAGIAVAALGSTLAGLGEARTALFSATAAALLYGGFVVPSQGSLAHGSGPPALPPRPAAPLPPPHDGERAGHDDGEGALGDQPGEPSVGDRARASG